MSVGTASGLNCSSKRSLGLAEIVSIKRSERLSKNTCMEKQSKFRRSGGSFITFPTYPWALHRRRTTFGASRTEPTHHSEFSRRVILGLLSTASFPPPWHIYHPIQPASQLNPAAPPHALSACSSHNRVPTTYRANRPRHAHTWAARAIARTASPAAPLKAAGRWSLKNPVSIACRRPALGSQRSSAIIGPFSNHTRIEVYMRPQSSVAPQLRRATARAQRTVEP
ncbi:hypothetical protein HYPSUDRAFT_202174 [Hypholoma sublateritium FD-334 SS-4]|uniref:Uncharacterized protein n=1 Tax=Hypholoma sublateritium (strain FD-334 SS-4) TaxID=945553 RepID=A0A0D2NU24_HYPSF|nr:hypothetical protein HYPSUDRAFT_202174 [Hypholoma sublateritium FD-334 SS-4]